jgi:hypothetical protein
MALEGVPYAIDENALHDAATMRMLGYISFAGTEGCVGGADLYVQAQTVPDGTIRVAPGAGAIINRAIGEAYQSYAFRNTAQENIDINPTTPSGPRTDLIVVRVENPYLSGEPWSLPLDLEEGPYVHFRVIENVTSTVTTVKEVDPTLSAIAIAKVTIPASTGTITQGMITDLRRLSAGLKEEYDSSTHCDNGQLLLNTQTTFVHFPNQASYNLVVPEWATHMSIYSTIDPAVVYNGTVHGIHAAWRWNIANGALFTAETDLDINTPMTSGGQGDYRTMKSFAGRIVIDPAWRGTSIVVKPEMKMIKTFVDHHDNIRCNRGTNVVVTFVFRQTPVGA